MAVDPERWEALDIRMEQRMEELYLISAQTNERFVRYEERLVKFAEWTKRREAKLDTLIEKQRQLVDRQAKQRQALFADYSTLKKWGLWFTGALVVGFIALFVWWWHLDDKSTALQQAIDVLPVTVNVNGQEYVKVKQDASAQQIQQPNGDNYPGYYVPITLR